MRSACRGRSRSRLVRAGADRAGPARASQQLPDAIRAEAERADRRRVDDQENVRGDESAGGESGRGNSARVRSEVAFIALPGSAGWMGFRRVLKVDKADVEDKQETLLSVLAGGSHDDYVKARAMLADSARYNLGSPRTTNLPNLPLEVLHPRTASGSRCASPARSGSAARTPPSWYSSRTHADDHPRLRQRRHAQHRHRIRRDRDRVSYCAPT